MADAPAAGGGGGGSPADQAKGMLENPVMVLILGFVTCGLFSLYWLWVRVKEMNAALGKQQVNPMLVFPGCICAPVMWYASWLYAQGFLELQKKKGGEVKDEVILHTILLILLAPVGQWMIQQKLNEMAAK
jgi:hypothetical protein